jgi:hypothetical protein
MVRRLLARLRRRPRAPLAVAGILAVPLFFSSLLAFTLALEKPQTRVVVRAGKSVVHYAQATSSNQAEIWLLALVPSLALVAVGVIGMLVPFGRYLVPGVGIVDALLVIHRLDFWAARHSARFPVGVDLIPDKSPSSTLTKGQWEASAVWASRSLAHWTIGIAIAAVVITAVVDARRRREHARLAALPAESTPQPPGMAL